MDLKERIFLSGDYKFKSSEQRGNIILLLGLVLLAAKKEFTLNYDRILTEYC